MTPAIRWEGDFYYTAHTRFTGEDSPGVFQRLACTGEAPGKIVRFRMPYVLHELEKHRRKIHFSDVGMPALRVPDAVGEVTCYIRVLCLLERLSGRSVHLMAYRWNSEVSGQPNLPAWSSSPGPRGSSGGNGQDPRDSREASHYVLDL